MSKNVHSPENPQFALPNLLMRSYIAALGIAADMEQKAHIDPLTALPNRRALEETYAGLQGSEERGRISDLIKPPELNTHSLLLLDLDHFKAINDSLGHAGGDRVLRKMADVVSGRVRKRDLAARIGGEEMAVLLPRTGVEQAVLVAEDIRKLTEETGDVTVSIGVTGVDLSKSLEGNLERADIALYTAKEQGRNRIVQYEPVLHQT